MFEQSHQFASLSHDFSFFFMTLIPKADSPSDRKLLTYFFDGVAL